MIRLIKLLELPSSSRVAPNVVPHALLHNLKHNKILHERNVLVTVDVQDIPYVSKDDRFSC